MEGPNLLGRLVPIKLPLSSSLSPCVVILRLDANILSVYTYCYDNVTYAARKYRMTDSNHISTENLQPVDCVCNGLRRAARMATKSYDNALRPSGLRTTQFTMLASLNRLGETSIGDLSEELATDGTTLTRNLEILVRRGLVENVEADDGRVRNIRLTDLGKETFVKAVPLWRSTQQQVLEALKPERWIGIKAQLREIEVACGNSE